MIQETAETILFKNQLRDSLLKGTSNYRSTKIAKHTNIYNTGDKDGMVYFIESGQVKLVVTSPDHFQ